jgi:hypothetical protein
MKPSAVYSCVLLIFSLTLLITPVTSATSDGLRLVVRGTDNGVYGNSLSGATWSGWSLVSSGHTLSAPRLCPSFSIGGTQLVIRGTNNKVYHANDPGPGSAWNKWDTGGGVIIDQPSCAVIGSVVHVVARGSDNGLYYNRVDLSLCAFPSCLWVGWQSLGGQTFSPPSLVAAFGLNRLDLVVRGVNNGIYHKSWTPTGGWTGWDTLGGATIDSPSLGATQVEDLSMHANNFLILVVRGIDDKVYENRLIISCDFPGCVLGWRGWAQLGGKTLAAPAMTMACFGSCVGSNSQGELVVRGTNNAIYHKSFTGSADATGGSWSATWDSPGGVATLSPAITYDLIGGLAVVVVGTNSKVYYTNRNSYSGTWSPWLNLGGGTHDNPTIAADF